MMEAWRDTWRRGVAPLLSTDGLEALRKALAEDDVRLLQGATTTPPPLHCVQDWPVEAACPIGYAWATALGGFSKLDDGTNNPEPALVAEVEEQFARTCFECDQRVGEPAAVRWFLNWADDTPRDEMRRELLPEVDAELARRAALEMVS
jgi:hypothetical protein